MLGRSRAAALLLHEKLKADPRFLTPFTPELDIVVWSLRSGSVSGASKLARRIFDEAARQNLHLALVQLPVAFFEFGPMKVDHETVICLRSVLMKSEHLDWIERIWSILDAATAAVFQRA